MDPQKLIELTRNRSEALTEMETINTRAADENRALTEEEKSLFERKKQEVDDIDEVLKREKKLEELRGNSGSPGIIAPDGGSGEVDEDELRYSNLGAFLRDVYEGNSTELRAHNISNGGSLGWQVPTELESGVLSLTGPEGFIRARARVIPAGEKPDAEYKKMVKKQGLGGFYAGFEFSVTGEGKKGSEDESEEDYVEILLSPMKCKVTGHTYISQESLDNTEATTVDIENSFKKALARYEEHLFLNGTGNKQPLGLLKSSGAAKVKRNESDSFDYDDFLRLKELFYGENPSLVISRALYSTVGQISDKSGRLLFKEGSIANKLPDTLGGIPIMWTYTTVPAGKTGDVIIVDFDYYWIKDGSGPYVKTNPYEKFDNDMIKIKIAKRVDAMFVIKEPVKIEGSELEVSPLVILQEEKVAA